MSILCSLRQILDFSTSTRLQVSSTSANFGSIATWNWRVKFEIHNPPRRSWRVDFLATWRFISLLITFPLLLRNETSQYVHVGVFLLSMKGNLCCMNTFPQHFSSSSTIVRYVVYCIECGFHHWQPFLPSSPLLHCIALWYVAIKLNATRANHREMKKKRNFSLDKRRRERCRKKYKRVAIVVAILNCSTVPLTHISRVCLLISTNPRSMAICCSRNGKIFT